MVAPDPVALKPVTPEVGQEAVQLKVEEGVASKEILTDSPEQISFEEGT